MKKNIILSIFVLSIVIVGMTACGGDKKDASKSSDGWSPDSFEDITFQIDTSWKKDAVSAGENISAASYYSSLSEENDKSDYTITFLDYSNAFTYDTFIAGKKEGAVEESENGVSSTSNVLNWSNNGLSGLMYDVVSEYTDSYLNEYYSNVNMVGNVLSSRSLVFDEDGTLYCITLSVYNPDTRFEAMENYEKVVDSIEPK